MNKAPASDGLGELRRRLTSGTYPSFTASWRALASVSDLEVLEDWPGDQLALLSSLPSGAGNPNGTTTWEPNKAIASLSAWMRSESRLLRMVLYQTDKILDGIPDACESGRESAIRRWIGMCWVAEAAWLAVTADVPEQTAVDAVMLRPVAARLRFLVFSEPMRWRGQDGPFPASLNGVSRVFGARSWGLLLMRCREARREWQECLDVYQSHPLLSQAKPKELEEELGVLLFQHAFHGNRWHAGAPLGLPPENMDQPARLTAEDQAFVTDVTEQHLLPRFDVSPVARLGLFDDVRAWRWARGASALAVALTAAAAVGFAAALDVNIAAVLAAACYLLICAGVAAFPQQWGAIWLLRMPAASAVGIIALISLLPAPWFTSSADPGVVTVPPRGWVATAVLIAVSYGYLLVQARNHGVARGAALGRALGVLLIGAIHALLVSLVGLDIVGPAFVGNGHNLIALVHEPEYGQAGLALALSAAWCLAVGVFSQILWQDRPITATLAHMSWRKS